MPQNDVYDVLIAGAGYAGLTAASLLMEAGKKVLVVEARERVGGRVLTKTFPDGSYIDLGAQWVGPGQEKWYTLAAKAGIKTFPTFNSGKSSLYFNGILKTYKGLIPPLSVPALISLNNAIKKINRLSAAVSLSEPWNHPRAAAFDHSTLSQWMDRQIWNTKAKTLFRLACEAIFAAHPGEISLLFALFYIHSGNNFDTLMNIRDGAQQDRFIGGADGPARFLAAGLKDRVLLNHPVFEVISENGLVHVQGKSFRLTAKRLIMAIPPVMAAKIRFSPLLPPEKWQLLQRIPMGCVWKCYVIYHIPFWRKNQINGLVVSDFGYASLVFDNSPPDGSKGILMAFVLADKARAFSKLNQDEREAHILNALTRFFGNDAGEPELYMDHCWAEEEWSGGCYTGIMGTHTLSSLGKNLRTPTGLIHWAGTETAEEWNGYVEGAIRSGERAALEVLKEM